MHVGVKRQGIIIVTLPPPLAYFRSVPFFAPHLRYRWLRNLLGSPVDFWCTSHWYYLQYNNQWSAAIQRSTKKYDQNLPSFYWELHEELCLCARWQRLLPSPHSSHEHFLKTRSKRASPISPYGRRFVQQLRILCIRGGETVSWAYQKIPLLRMLPLLQPICGYCGSLSSAGLLAGHSYSTRTSHLCYLPIQAKPRKVLYDCNIDIIMWIGMNKDEPVDSIGGELLCVAETFIHFICLVGSQMKTGQKIYNDFAVFFNRIHSLTKFSTMFNASHLNHQGNKFMMFASCLRKDSDL